MPATQVAIVPHTHWDREWYEPFQTYRLRLVKLLDEFLPLLERDPGYRHFLLDGQTAVVDDYLEVRPEAEDRIRRLVASGRLAVGPWMILMDEFMVSGETIVRNLQAGMKRGAELGGAMEVGYLPDMFGHVAQMPQILSLAGLDHAVVWRGVPLEVDRTGFWWTAPDGSTVRAEYLYGSYSNGRDIPRSGDLLVERARSYVDELGAARLDGVLLMNGTDHQVPQPWLGDVVEAANGEQDSFHFEVTSLAEYVRRQPTDDLPTVTGELRSGARANLLMGVASNRVDVHQAAAHAERVLERAAEPLAALVLPPGDSSAALLGVAWHNLVVNSAHDSSCACSHDEVVDQVLVRYHEARQVAEGVAKEAVSRLAVQVDAPPGSTVVVNPTPATRGGLTPAIPVPGTGPVHFVDDNGSPVPTQVLSEEAGDRFAAHVVASKLGWVLDMLRGEEFAGAPVTDWEVTPRDGDHFFDVVVRGAGPGDPHVDVGPLRDRLLELGAEGEAAGVDTAFLVRAVFPTRRWAVLEARDVAGYGWRTYDARDGEGPPPDEPAVADDSTVANGLVSVEVDPATGTFTARTADGVEASGLNRLVNGGDGGDTYNYSPPDDDVIVEDPESVETRVVEAGPLRASLEIVRRYRWPLHAEGDERSCRARSAELADVEVTTRVELRSGEPFVRVRCELDNPCRDQRLRAHFPLPAPVTSSDSECAFSVVTRGLAAEGGPNEFGLATYPSRRFVDAGDGAVGLAVLHDGLLEHEVVADGGELAVTLMRSVGYLSRIEPSLRPNPAGPPIPVEGAQMPGRHAFDFALLLHRGDWQEARLHERADEFLVPLRRAPAAGVGHRPRGGRLAAVEGAEVSALYREPGGLVLRVYNPTSAPCTASVARDGTPSSGWVVDLRGRPQERFEGTVELRPSEIKTLRVADAAQTLVPGPR